MQARVIFWDDQESASENYVCLVPGGYLVADDNPLSLSLLYLHCLDIRMSKRQINIYPSEKNEISHTSGDQNPENYRIIK